MLQTISKCCLQISDHDGHKGKTAICQKSQLSPDGPQGTVGAFVRLQVMIFIAFKGNEYHYSLTAKGIKPAAVGPLTQG